MKYSLHLADHHLKSLQLVLITVCSERVNFIVICLDSMDLSCVYGIHNIFGISRIFVAFTSFMVFLGHSLEASSRACYPDLEVLCLGSGLTAWHLLGPHHRLAVHLLLPLAFDI